MMPALTDIAVALSILGAMLAALEFGFRFGVRSVKHRDAPASGQGGRDPRAGSAGRQHIVVLDQPHRLSGPQRRVRRIGQRHGERLAGLKERVAHDRDGDGL